MSRAINGNDAYESDIMMVLKGNDRVNSRARRGVLAGAVYLLAALTVGAEVSSGAAGVKSMPVEVIVYVSDLPGKAFHEFEIWKEPASPGGKMAGITNTGDELDPPPENDPHVTFRVKVQQGVPYHCWLHMKVGKPKGKSRANMVYAQFTDAVDTSNKEILQPQSASYLILRGPSREGWAWVGGDLADPKPAEPRIRFRTSGEITVRLQGGMEGVGFDQFILSPGRYLEKAPSEAVVKK